MPQNRLSSPVFSIQGRDETVNTTDTSANIISSAVEIFESPPLPTTLRRRLQEDSPVFTVFLFLFGALIMIGVLSLSRSYRRAEIDEERRIQEEQRLAEELAVKQAEKCRKHLTDSFSKHELEKVLKLEDFRRPAANYNIPLALCFNGEHVGKEKENSQEVRDLLEVGRNDKGKIQCVSENDVVADNHDGSERLPEERAEIETKMQGEDIDGLKLSYIILPRGDQSSAIPIACAICLDHYEAGDTVVWSGNDACTHGFHKECILDYLVHHNIEAAPCPCCRQIFMPMNK